MRAGLVIYDDLDSISGGYLYDRKLVAYLRNLGDEVEVISIRGRNYAQHLLDNISPGLLRRFKRGHFDVLLQDELNHPSLFALNRMFPHDLPSNQDRLSPAYADQRTNPCFPVITIVHHLRSCEEFPDPQKKLYRFIESQYLSSVDGFIFNSRATKGEVIRAGVNLRGRPSIIAHPAGDNLKSDITESEIKNRARAAGPLRLVFVGNIIPRKGLHILLEALEPIPNNLYHLDIVGSIPIDSNYGQEIRNMLSNRAAAGTITIYGYLDDIQLGQILRKSHLMVVPSSYEGFGISYLEGMGFGLPAVGTNAGGAAEVITHGSDGYLIKPGDTQALQQHILELAHDRGRLLQMSLAAYRRFKGHPSWDLTCKSIRDFIVSICMGNQ